MAVPADLHVSAQQASEIRHYLQQHHGEVVVKLLLLGTSSTGKDSILTRMVWQAPELLDIYDPTTLVPSYRQVFTVQNEPVLLECDTCEMASGPAEAEAVYTNGMMHHSVKQSDAIMYVYSVIDKESFKALSEAHQRLGDSLSNRWLSVAANKTDWPEVEWDVTRGESKDLSSKIKAPLFLASAKSGAGCGENDAASLIAQIILSRIEAGRLEQPGRLPVDEFANESSRGRQILEWSMRQVKRLMSRKDGTK